MQKYCQACGNPIFNDASYGTEADGQHSRDFCSNCYNGGHFSGDYRYVESPMALAAPYYPGMYGYVGYNLY